MGDQVGAPLTQRRVSKRLLAQDETDGTNPPKKKAALFGLLGFAILKIIFVIKKKDQNFRKYLSIWVV